MMFRLGICPDIRCRIDRVIAVGIAIALTARVASTQAIVRGEVFDSLFTGAPMEGAAILLQGSAETVTSDRRGRFAIRDLPAGRYAISFFHPRLDSLGLGAPVRVVDVGDRGTVMVSLATPSANGLSLRLCGHPAEAATAVIFGFARSAEDGAPVVGAEASVRWFDYELRGRASRQQERLATDRTREDGRYLLCGVPNDIALSLRVVQGRQSTGALHLALDAAGVARRDVTLSLSDTAARWTPESALDDTLSVVRPPGTARLRVLVRNEQQRRIRGAIVGIRGTMSFAVTDDSGRVILTALPAGSQTLAVRAIGLSPFLQVVALAPGAESTLDVTLERFATVLPSVAVVGQRIDPLDADILRRRRSGQGHYFDGAALREASSAGLGFWASIPGMSSGGEAGPDAMPRMRSDFGSRCIPEVWSDGRRLASIDGWELRALLLNARRMEVFTRPTSVPPEFTTGSMNPCGAILVWSH